MRKVEIKMKLNNRFFIAMLSIIIGAGFSAFETADAASRVAIRSTSGTAPRRSIGVATPQTTNLNTTNETLTSTSQDTVSASDSTEPEEIIIENKSSSFDVSLSAEMESSVSDNTFAEQIRKQRAAFEASEATTAATTAQQNALRTSSNTCDKDLRKCMATKCGNDFTKCATDGDTMFGDKLNACRRDTECTGEEFRLFTTEIKADRDMNVRLASYNKVIDCGNQYNACLVNECGKTYNKCLGKTNADAATKKCETIAKECVESDSGLANRFGIAIGKLRESAEKEVKKDDERMYAMRDSMQSVCKRMGAMFDERTFDCVFTVNFFAGNDQKNPMASRKRYAGDTFVCMQEWFGVDTTTYKENAYRETRAQTGASSAMLGSGVGTAVGLLTSGAVGRALDTQKAKKDFKSECESQGGTLKGGECVFANGKAPAPNTDTKAENAKTEEPASNKTMEESINDYKEHGQAIVDASKETLKKAGVQPQEEQKHIETPEMKPTLSTSNSMLNTDGKSFFGINSSSSSSNATAPSASGTASSAGKVASTTSSTSNATQSNASSATKSTKNTTAAKKTTKAKSSTSSSSSNTKKTTTSSGNKTNEPKKSEFVKMLENNQQNFSWK